MSDCFFQEYSKKLQKLLNNQSWEQVFKLARMLQIIWRENKQVFLCGNGGSAANAIHFANDLIYGVSKNDGEGLKVQALSSNSAILTCLANDISYEDIFSQQITVWGNPGDLLIAFSGSGNSPNIIKAIKEAKKLNLITFAIVGYSGGKSLELADMAIHFPIDDMQIAEDCQQIVCHMIMKWLAENRKR